MKVKRAKTKTTSAKPASKKPCCNAKVAGQLPRSKSVIDTIDENEGHWRIGMGITPRVWSSIPTTTFFTYTHLLIFCTLSFHLSNIPPSSPFSFLVT